jgi:ParB family chromosome partitioning protein
MREDLPLYVSPREIDPNPLQPRHAFEEHRLAELAQSIKSHGIIQPLVVSRKGSRYQLIAGERRWRAAKLIHLPAVPILIREVEPQHLLEITLIENIQREDLSAIETAVAFQRMATELNLNAEEIGIRTGKDRSTVVNFIRLLQLPQDLQDLIAAGKLSAGHGRCLLTLPTSELQHEVAQQARAGNWSVRQTERMCAKMTQGPAPPKHVEEVKIDPNVKAAIQEMERKLGTKVHVKEGARGRGRIEIEYYSAEDLDRIYDAIMGEP